MALVLALPAQAQAQFLSDTFTEPTINTVLSSHSAETGGACWVEHGSYTDDLSVSEANDRLLASAGADFGLYYCSVVPADANYEVVGDIFVVSNAAAGYPGVVGRVDTAANTHYRVYYDQADGRWELYRFNAGVSTSGGTFSQSLTNSQTYALKLEMVSDVIKVYIDGVERIAWTDPSPITAAGRAGVLQYASSLQELTSVTATSLSGGGATPSHRLLLGCCEGSGLHLIAGVARQHRIVPQEPGDEDDAREDDTSDEFHDALLPGVGTSLTGGSMRRTR
ncbi:MAG: hypothetical protein EPO40_01350 [Myxococcaceae bacterium]|nr:MAG: hypothetical protein EPO40_01350 [Myxococcaceae bacterium]